MEMNTYSQIR